MNTNISLEFLFLFRNESVCYAIGRSTCHSNFIVCHFPDLFHYLRAHFIFYIHIHMARIIQWPRIIMSLIVLNIIIGWSCTAASIMQ